MLEILFLIRHIPFWGVPFMILGAEFAYLFWLRKKKKSAVFWLILAFVGFLNVVFYMWAGGPDKSVKIIKKMYINNR